MFITMFDERYAQWARVLLRSLRFYHPTIPVLIVGVDLSRESTAMFSDLHPATHVWSRTIHDWSLRRPATIANTRPFWLLEVVSTLMPEWALFLDADLLVRKSLNEMIASTAEMDAGLVMRHGFHRGAVRRHLRVAAGLVLIRRNGVPLLDRWCQLLKRNSAVEGVSPGAWFWEQVCLFDAAELSPDLDIGKIDASKYLSSPPFLSNAYVWSANVKSPEKDAILEIFEGELEQIGA